MSKSYSTGRSQAGKRLALLIAPALFFAATNLIAATPEDQAGRSPLARQVDAVRGKADSLARVTVFNSQTQAASRNAETGKALDGGALLDLAPGALANLNRNRPRSMTLVLPTRERGTVELELVQRDIFAPDFKIEASGGEDTSKLNRGLHYRGVVKGEAGSFAAISVFDREVMGTFSTPTDGNWVVGRLDGANKENRHVVYAEANLVDKSRAPTCAMDEKNQPESFAEYWEDRAVDAAVPAPDAVETVKCATQWLEAEYDVFQNRGSMQATTDYLTGIFNNSSTLYENDGITLKLQQLYIWSSADPYNGSSSTSNLSSFQSSRASSFTGTIAQLVTFRSLGGGVAAGFSGICNASRSASMCTSGINTAYSNVPTYSWTISVITHEAGHLLGSRHTHACVWNGNNTAIDSCAGSTEGGCALPGIPSGGGTIMSYCHLTSTGINFNKGFGSQPAQTIRNRVEGGSCLSSSCGGGGGETTLSNYTAVTGVSGAAGAQRVFKIDVPAGTQAISFNTWGGTGDLDIYVKQGSAPTTSNATCQSTGTTSTEVCKVSNPAAGTWYVLAVSDSATSNVSISAAYAGSCSGTLEVGALTGTGAQAILPSTGGSYTSAGSGAHVGNSRGPGNADFELELQKQSGSTWSKVAEGVSSTSTESVNYNGTAGTYRWRPYSYSGSGGYSVCYSKPN